MDDNKYDEQLGDMAEEDNSVPDIENNENTPDIEDNHWQTEHLIQSSVRYKQKSIWIIYHARLSQISTGLASLLFAVSERRRREFGK